MVCNLYMYTTNSPLTPSFLTRSNSFAITKKNIHAASTMHMIMEKKQNIYVWECVQMSESVKVDHPNWSPCLLESLYHRDRNMDRAPKDHLELLPQSTHKSSVCSMQKAHLSWCGLCPKNKLMAFSGVTKYDLIYFLCIWEETVSQSRV